MKSIITFLMIASIFYCCKKTKDYDASGTFEAIETIVPAQANGIIRSFQIQEGQQLKEGELIGYIDSTQLYLKKRQLQAQKIAVLSQQPNIPVQVEVLKEQLTHAQNEQTRISNLYKADAATGKQLDDANAQIALLKKQIASQTAVLQTTTNSIKTATNPIAQEVGQIEDQLQKCRIINPINGTVLTKYAEQDEMASIGKPLYKIADMSYMELRAYFSGNQFAQLKINQPVTVYADDGNGGFKQYKGSVTWISDVAEFTPKTIQTKAERVDLVYAVKIRVKNDGYLKIGMYGEVKLNGVQ